MKKIFEDAGKKHHIKGPVYFLNQWTRKSQWFFPEHSATVLSQTHLLSLEAKSKASSLGKQPQESNPGPLPGRKRLISQEVPHQTRDDEFDKAAQLEEDLPMPKRQRLSDAPEIDSARTSNFWACDEDAGVPATAMQSDRSEERLGVPVVAPMSTGGGDRGEFTNINFMDNADESDVRGLHDVEMHAPESEMVQRRAGSNTSTSRSPEQVQAERVGEMMKDPDV